MCICKENVYYYNVIVKVYMYNVFENMKIFIVLYVISI